MKTLKQVYNDYLKHGFISVLKSDLKGFKSYFDGCWLDDTHTIVIEGDSVNLYKI